MERELAERMLAAIKSLNPGLDEASRITELMPDKKEAQTLRRHLGGMMSGPLYEIVMHVVRQHPELDPDANELSEEPPPKT